MMDYQRTRRGFTLVELLVVLALTGILIGFLFPAIQGLRAVARLNSCANNQKQIATALLHFESTFEKFPAMATVEKQFVNWPFPGSVGMESWSWQTKLLTYMEQKNANTILNVVGAPAYKISAHARSLSGLSVLDVLQTPLFVCPSDNGPLLTTKRSISSQSDSGAELGILAIAKANYIGVNSTLECTNFINNESRNNTHGVLPGGETNPITMSNTGVFDEINSPRRFDEIKDGTANTAMIGERAWQYKRNGKTYNSFAAIQLVNRDTRNVEQNTIGRISEDDSNDSFGQGDSDTCGTLANGHGINYPHDDPAQAMNTFSSMHYGGANFGFADGSIHFVAENIDPQTLSNLGNVADGRVTGEY